MLGRFVVILFLLIKAAFWYLLVLTTRKKKQSVLVVPSFTKYGGTRTYFFYLIEFLAQKNYSISVMLTKSQCDEEVKALQGKYNFSIQETAFIPIRTTFEGTVFYKKNQEYFIYHLEELIYFWKYLVKLKCSQLIISEANPEVLLSLLASPLKVTYIIHTITMNRMDTIKRTLLSTCLSKRKQILTVSRSAKQHFLENWTNGKYGDFIKVIYNFYQPRNGVVQQHQQGVKTILTVGSLIHYKNPFLWIEVCKEVILRYTGGSVEFIWAGDGPLLEPCQVLVKDTPGIKFIGYQQNIDQLYLNCTVYFQPSIYESHGMSVLGAMFYEKPCVVSDRQGLPESVINNETGLVVSVDGPVESATAILSLLNSDQKADQLGQAGKERLDRNFSRRKWYSEMDAIFN